MGVQDLAKRPRCAALGGGLRRDGARSDPGALRRAAARVFAHRRQPALRPRRRGQAWRESAARLCERAQHRDGSRHSGEHQRTAGARRVDRLAGESADRACHRESRRGTGFSARESSRASTISARRGQKPTNQALLDHLATRLVEDGWSMKKTHPRNRAQPHLPARVRLRRKKLRRRSREHARLAHEQAPARRGMHARRDARVARARSNCTPPIGSLIARAGDGPIGGAAASRRGRRGGDHQCGRQPAQPLSADRARRPARRAGASSISPRTQPRRRARAKRRMSRRKRSTCSTARS